jgi:hypothetical protein
MFRNPFGVRDNRIILISDLSLDERGLRCKCKCPACDGDFIARMGDIKVHHFAHHKDACDEVLAYVNGLYKFIWQILNDGAELYVPPIIVEFRWLRGEILAEGTVASHAQIVSEERLRDERLFNYRSFKVSEGRFVAFDSVKLLSDKKGYANAIEAECKGSKMAIKLVFPSTVCKDARTPTRHEDMATLALNLGDDADTIQVLNSIALQEHITSERADKFWVYNPKVIKAYPAAISASKEAYQHYLERKKQLETEKELLTKKREEERALKAKSLKEALARRLEEKKILVQKREEEIVLYAKMSAEAKARKEAMKLEERANKTAAGYEEVKGKFTQQTSQILDSFGRRWFKCKYCSEIKGETEITMHGPLDSAINHNICFVCMRKLET